MTREDVKKINSECKNGFEFYLYGYLMRKEKELSKRIALANNKFLEARLEWDKVFKRTTNEYGCSWNVETGEVEPVLRLSVWTNKETGVAVSYGFGYTEIAGSPVKRRSMKSLQALTGNYTTEDIVRLYEQKSGNKLTLA